MITVYHKVAPIVRIVALMMILVIGIKTTVVVVTAASDKKEAVTVEKADLNEENNTATNYSPENEDTAATLNQAVAQPILSFTNIVHQTAYFINYGSFFTQKITIPPPDLS